MCIYLGEINLSKIAMDQITNYRYKHYDDINKCKVYKFKGDLTNYKYNRKHLIKQEQFLFNVVEITLEI